MAPGTGDLIKTGGCKSRGGVRDGVFWVARSRILLPMFVLTEGRFIDVGTFLFSDELHGFYANPSNLAASDLKSNFLNQITLMVCTNETKNNV